MLQKGTDRFLTATPATAKLYQAELLIALEQLKGWLSVNAETAKKIVVEFQVLNFDDMGDLLLTAAILVLLLFLAVAVTPIAFAGITGHVAYRLYNESPARAERVARDETMALYHAAQARNVSFEEAEIDDKLSAGWPHHPPPPALHD